MQLLLILNVIKRFIIISTINENLPLEIYMQVYKLLFLFTSLCKHLLTKNIHCNKMLIAQELN